MVRARFPEVRLIANGGNPGFGRAQNQAIAVARGRYVLMLNNDATVEPGTMPALVRLMDDHPTAGACSCPDRAQVALGTATAGAFRAFPSLGRTVVENVWAVVRPPRTWDIRWLTAPVHRWIGDALPASGVVDVAWLVGALIVVRRDVMTRIGGFDERFDQGWVERCVRTGSRAFAEHFARPAASFSMGMDWTNQATVRLARGLDVRYDFSAVLGKEPQPFPPRDSYTGVAPDCSAIPERPYRPAPDDFRRPAAEPGDDTWVFPLSTQPITAPSQRYACTWSPTSSRAARRSAKARP